MMLEPSDNQNLEDIQKLAKRELELETETESEWKQVQEQEQEQKSRQGLGEGQEQEQDLCCVCFDAVPQVAFLPCKHYTICFECAKTIASDKCSLSRLRFRGQGCIWNQMLCPMCRSPVLAAVGIPCNPALANKLWAFQANIHDAWLVYQTANQIAAGEFTVVSENNEAARIDWNSKCDECGMNPVIGNTYQTTDENGNLKNFFESFEEKISFCENCATGLDSKLLKKLSAHSFVPANFRNEQVLRTERHLEPLPEPTSVGDILFAVLLFPFFVMYHSGLALFRRESALDPLWWKLYEWKNSFVRFVSNRLLRPIRNFTGLIRNNLRSPANALKVGFARSYIWTRDHITKSLWSCSRKTAIYFILYPMHVLQKSVLIPAWNGCKKTIRSIIKSSKTSWSRLHYFLFQSICKPSTNFLKQIILKPGWSFSKKTARVTTKHVNSMWNRFGKALGAMKGFLLDFTEPFTSSVSNVHRNVRSKRRIYDKFCYVINAVYVNIIVEPVMDFVRGVIDIKEYSKPYFGCQTKQYSTLDWVDYVSFPFWLGYKVVVTCLEPAVVLIWNCVIGGVWLEEKIINSRFMQCILQYAKSGHDLAHEYVISPFAKVACMAWSVSKKAMSFVIKMAARSGKQVVNKGTRAVRLSSSKATTLLKPVIKKVHHCTRSAFLRVKRACKQIVSTERDVFYRGKRALQRGSRTISELTRKSWTS